MKLEVRKLEMTNRKGGEFENKTLKSKNQKLE